MSRLSVAMKSQIKKVFVLFKFVSLEIIKHTRRVFVEIRARGQDASPSTHIRFVWFCLLETLKS